MDAVSRRSDPPVDVPDRTASAPANELGSFLRARRASLTPEDVGLGDDGRQRRVPGLRREELAQLAHVSTEYIVRLEQGRMRTASRPVLESLAAALLLDADEQAYLFRLAEVTQTATHRLHSTPRPVSRQLRQLVEAMTDIPAVVLNGRLDVLAWNAAASALLSDFAAIPSQQRNLVRMTFLDPAYRALFADWSGVARRCVAVLRREAGLHPHDVALAALVGELSVRDRDFRAWWASHEVKAPRRLSKAYHHPIAGELTLDVQQFAVESEAGQVLATYTAPSGSASEDALGFLLRWAAPRS